jgi:hypothetical protein
LNTRDDSAPPTLAPRSCARSIKVNQDLAPGRLVTVYYGRVLTQMDDSDETSDDFRGFVGLHHVYTFNHAL